MAFPSSPLRPISRTSPPPSHGHRSTCTPAPPVVWSPSASLPGPRDTASRPVHILSHTSQTARDPPPQSLRSEYLFSSTHFQRIHPHAHAPILQSPRAAAPSPAPRSLLSNSSSSPGLRPPPTSFASWPSPTTESLFSAHHITTLSLQSSAGRPVRSEQFATLATAHGEQVSPLCTFCRRRSFDHSSLHSPCWQPSSDPACPEPCEGTSASSVPEGSH